MALYVVALIDRQLPPMTIGGRRYESVRSGRVHAVVQRRTRPPLRKESELRRQFATVVKLAATSESILPVRFGTFMDRRTLDAALRTQQDALLRALQDVRGRVQMSIRIVGRARPVSNQRIASGREYLAHKQRLSSLILPKRAAGLLARLEHLVVRERKCRGSGQLLATVYHLVDASSVEPYLEISTRHPSPGVVVTGPFPPFAFASEVE